MRPVLLFLILCWHLPGGHRTASASDFHYQRSYAVAQGMEIAQQVSTADANTHLLATEWNSLTEDITHFISIEDDEEEDATRKHVSLARYILASPLPFPIAYHYSCPGGSLSLCKPSFGIKIPKYIIQSTLKI